MAVVHMRLIAGAGGMVSLTRCSQWIPNWQMVTKGEDELVTCSVCLERMARDVERALLLSRRT